MKENKLTEKDLKEIHLRLKEIQKDLKALKSISEADKKKKIEQDKKKGK